LSDPQALASFLFHQHLINICQLCCRDGIASQRHAQGCQYIRAGALPAERQAVFDLIRGPRFGHEIPAHVVGAEDLPESVLVDRLAVST
jgi:hypothetical protein